MSNKPNILLVHGAWGDASHWAKVIPALVAKGYNVRAVQNPLTSLADDVARTKKLAESMQGPTLLVGHSYGGAVISGAGHAANVVGLVFIAAFAPDEGEALGGLLERSEPPPGGASIRPDAEGFLWLDPASFHQNFCQNVDATEALVMAVTQKPISGQCFGDPAGAPAWKVKPSWYQVSTNDRMIPPDTERWFAQRMQAKKTIEVETDHASLASQPGPVIALIEEAAEALS